MAHQKQPNSNTFELGYFCLLVSATRHAKHARIWFGAGGPEKKRDELLTRILASGKKLIQHAQGPDGNPIPLAQDPGQLYFDERSYRVNSILKTQRYGKRYGITVKED